MREEFGVIILLVSSLLCALYIDVHVLYFPTFLYWTLLLLFFPPTIWHVHCTTYSGCQICCNWSRLR